MINYLTCNNCVLPSRNLCSSPKEVCPSFNPIEIPPKLDKIFQLFFEINTQEEIDFIKKHLLKITQKRLDEKKKYKGFEIGDIIKIYHEQKIHFARIGITDAFIRAIDIFGKKFSSETGSNFIKLTKPLNSLELYDILDDIIFDSQYKEQLVKNLSENKNIKNQFSNLLEELSKQTEVLKFSQIELSGNSCLAICQDKIVMKKKDKEDFIEDSKLKTHKKTNMYYILNQEKNVEYLKKILDLYQYELEVC